MTDHTQHDPLEPLEIPAAATPSPPHADDASARLEHLLDDVGAVAADVMALET